MKCMFDGCQEDATVAVCVADFSHQYLKLLLCFEHDKLIEISAPINMKQLLVAVSDAIFEKDDGNGNDSDVGTGD